MKTRIAIACLAAGFLFPANTISAAPKSKTVTPAPKETPPPAQPGPNADLAYGAYQRGCYLFAFREATQRAEKQRDPQAMTLLGEMYAGGVGIRADEQKAFEWYRQASELGDSSAMVSLGFFYLRGQGIAPNREKAAEQFASAAERGNPTAAYNLGLLYLEGQVFPQDFTLAAKWLRAAAEQDIPDAQQALATLYSEGKGVTKDPAEAARWLARASALRHPASMTEYALALFSGKGIAKNENAAARWFRLAALYGNPIAQNRLAILLADGLGGMPKSPVEGLAWHLYARAKGASNLAVDELFVKMPDGERAAAEKIVFAWETGGPLPPPLTGRGPDWHLNAPDIAYIPCKDAQ